MRIYNQGCLGNSTAFAMARSVEYALLQQSANRENLERIGNSIIGVAATISATALALGIATATPVKQIECDMLEVHNLMCRDHIVFTQLIFWQRCHEGPAKWRSCGFVILRSNDDFPIRTGNGWTVEVTKEGKRFKVSSRLFRERSLEFDPERQSVEIWRGYAVVDLFSDYLMEVEK